MNFAAMLRVKDESRWIARVLKSLKPLCDRIYLLDDHSSDDTHEIAESFPGVHVFPSPFEGLNETRDKNYILNEAFADGWADYIVAVDGDEELEAAGQYKIRKLCEEQQPLAAYMHVVYLWDKPDQWRSDGLFKAFHRPSLFKMDRKHRTYISTNRNGNLHCSNVPHSLIQHAVGTDIKLLHWGWFDQELRARKYRYYNTVDPANEIEDQYRHAVIGDPCGPAADAVTKHAGPLRLEPLKNLGLWVP